MYTDSAVANKITDCAGIFQNIVALMEKMGEVSGASKYAEVHQLIKDLTNVVL